MHDRESLHIGPSFVWYVFGIIWIGFCMVLYGFVWFCMVYYGHVRPSEIGIATKKNPFGHQMVSMKNKSTTQEEIGPKDSEDTYF